jgi:predicted RNA polymerase sigma factor
VTTVDPRGAIDAVWRGWPSALKPVSNWSNNSPTEPALKSYPFLPGVRADLLFKLDRFDEARVEFERAAALTRNTRERELLLERAQACEAA